MKEAAEAYLKLFFEKQKLQWENYALSENHNLNEIDEKIFTLISSKLESKREVQNRIDQIFKSICVKDLIETSPDISFIRNKIDHLKFYSIDLDKDKFKSKYEYKVALGEKLQTDVIQLIDLRNEQARKYGYESYVDAVFCFEDLDHINVKKLLQKYLADHLPKVKKYIKDFNISWHNWFSDLDNIGASFNFQNDPNLLDDILEKLGFLGLKNNLHVYIKDQPLIANAMAVSVPDDIRILLSPTKSLNGFRVFLHELGHAVAHGFNENQNLFKTWTASYDEVMAVTFEKIGFQLYENEQFQDVANILAEIEAVRCTISFLFELDLWESPNEAKKLYLHHYKKLGLDLGQPEIWAYDSFRSIDPVYIHNYVLGEIIGESILKCLKQSCNSNYRHYGKWLKENFYFDGRETSLKEKLARAKLSILI